MGFKMNDCANKICKVLRPVAMSLLALDLSPQHLVRHQIRLSHICVPTAHHRTARGQRKRDT